MLELIRRSLSDLFDSPIKRLSFPSLPDPSPDESLKDLDFDIYEYDEKSYDYRNPFTPPPEPTDFAVTSYDWAFSFRESSKSEKKVVLEVSVERLAREPDANLNAYDTCCLPVSPAVSPLNTKDMTLLRGGHAAAPVEANDMMSEEEQNMIMAAIIASQCDDFESQIPRHVRDEMEHAAYIAALEESKELELANQAVADQHAAAPPAAKPVFPLTPPPSATFQRSATFAPPRTSMSSPGKPLTRSNSDIPWTKSPGEQVEGESEKQRRFRELMQFHAVAAASIANASARTGVSNITGNEDASDYDWLG
ncbi:hypothetical protein AA313_de0209406 [Arthrobotrys entomopaga]|nr:hypothetical protein AA313_de0209406 [Arthrobotrys entomopaga]